MSRLANGLLALSVRWAKWRHKEPRVVLGKHTIKIDYVKPHSNGRYDWDSDLYEWGNVFLDGYSNPVKPEPPEGAEEGDTIDEVDLVPSSTWKYAMKLDVIKKAFDTSGWTDRMWYTVLGIGALTALNTLLAIAILA